MIVVEQITGTRATQLQREIIEVSPSVVRFSFQSGAYLDKETYDPQDKKTDIFAEIDKAQKEIAGIIDADFTGEAGDTHTFNILAEHSGKTIHVQALYIVEGNTVTLTVGNDIEINQPITIRKTGEFTLILKGANDNIEIEANDVDTDGSGIQSVDISGETINTVQIMKASDNVIWGIGI